MKIKKSTIVRSIMFALVLINLALKQAGHPVIDASESTIAAAVEYGIEFAILLCTFWKNNSFSKNAQAADEYLEALKNLKEG